MPNMNPGEMIVQESTQDEKAVLDYWTEERIASAEPVPTPTLTDEELQKIIEQNASLPQDDTVIDIPGYDPESEEAEMAGVIGVPYQANVSARPFWNGGKFFFRDPVTKKNYVGSAQFVGASNMVLTAAHCVHAVGASGFYDQFLFRRAFSNGGGQAVGFNAWGVKSLWVQNGNFAYDYAFLRSTSTSGAGWLGFQSGIPYTNFSAIGYPSNYGNTQYMYCVEGTKGTVANGISEMLNNPMGPGCSGGAWIGALSPNIGGNYAIGLNSYGAPINEYGPLFNSDTWNLYLGVLNYK